MDNDADETDCAGAAGETEKDATLEVALLCVGNSTYSFQFPIVELGKLPELVQLPFAFVVPKFGVQLKFCWPFCAAQNVNGVLGTFDVKFKV